MKLVSIDSIGNIYAVCEDNNYNTIYLSIDELPLNAKEGDIIQINDDGTLEINTEETKKRKAEAIKLQNEIWKK